MVLPALRLAEALIPARNRDIARAITIIGPNMTEVSLRAFAKITGIGRETLRVAALNNFIFKSEFMTRRVEEGLARYNLSTLRFQPNTTVFQTPWGGESAITILPTPLVNGNLPTSVKFTIFDPEQQFISDGRLVDDAAYTTTSPRPIGSAPLIDIAVDQLGLDPSKIVAVTFR